MALFPQFNADQVWLVLVASGPGQKMLEHWLAPEGENGYRKILRQSNPKRRAVAAIPLTSLSKLGITRKGWWTAILKTCQGPEYALFKMSPDNGMVSVCVARGKTPLKAAKKQGSNIVGVYLLENVRSSVRDMRRMLDNQNTSAAHYNILKGEVQPTEVEEEMNLKFRPDRWTEPEMGV